MQTKQTKGINLDKLKQYNTNRIIDNEEFRPILLNVKLLSNPFLKDQQKYHYLVYKINEYNRRVQNNQITDPYEAMYYQRLHSSICDISFIDSKADQIDRLDETIKWVKEQEALIQQRKDQGYIRYQVTKESRHGFQPQNKIKNLSEVIVDEEMPSEVIARDLLPFKKNWRTTHKQLDIPARRLNEYKRKILNIAPFIQPKQQKKPPRITYPKMPKLQYNKQEEQPEDAPKVEDGAQPLPAPVDGQVKEGEQVNQEEANVADQQQQDLDFGGEKQQPEQEQPNQQDNQDKLAPKIKSYTVEYRDVTRKQYKGPYMFYKGEQCEVERRMEQRYMRLQQNQLKKQKQDKQAVDVIDQWAAGKSKMEKQHQKRLQHGMFSAKYSFSLEEAPKKQMLSQADQLRFGFTQNLIRPKIKEIQLGGVHLPKIGQQNMFEKSIRKDRLMSLKNKFGKLLNLQDDQTREASISLCQYSARKRGLSQIIRNHSKSKERLNQLDEVERIKQKLARNKVGIDVRSLSMGLCVPEQQMTQPDSIFPNKSLPSNPYMVETKKKKKKK